MKAFGMFQNTGDPGKAEDEDATLHGGSALLDTVADSEVWSGFSFFLLRSQVNLAKMEAD